MRRLAAPSVLRALMETNAMVSQPRTALITGASRGLGLEIARLFARQGTKLVITARGEAALREAEADLKQLTDVLAVPGDVSDRSHAELVVRRGLESFGRIDVLINNASAIGPSPMPDLTNYPLVPLARVFDVNVLAPLHLIQLVLPTMRDRGDGTIVNVTSDAAVEGYPTWGGYGSSKAALEQISRVLAVELEGSGVRVYWVDPGDMNTVMHQEAEPGVDLSHLPGPDVPAPAFLQLIDDAPPSGRCQAQQLIAVAGGALR